MARNPIQSQIVASGMDLTSDPVQMPLNRARGIVNFQNDRLGVLRTDLALVNQLPVPAGNPIDGVAWYYRAFIHNNAPGMTPDITTDLLVWVTGATLFIAQPSSDPLLLPVINSSFVFGGVTGYAGTGAFFLGKRVRFASLQSELLMVQEGGLLPLRFYSTQSFGTGFYRAGIEPPTNTGSVGYVPALLISATGTGLTGDYSYKLTFADERFRESSPTTALTITVANQGVQARYDDSYTDATFPVYGGSNLRYAYLYRNTIGAPSTYYQIARATIPMFHTNPVTFATGDFYYNSPAAAYDNATDAAIEAGGILAPNPGENDPPNPASVICIWKNRVLLNDVTDTTVIQISNLLSPTQWTSLPTTPVSPTDGVRTSVGTDQGDPITAIVDFGSFAAIFKRRQVFFLSGNSLDDFLIQPVHTRGCLSPDSAVRCDNVVMFLSDDGVYAASYGGGEAVQKVSKEIEAELLSLSQTDRENSIAWFVDNSYHISIGTVTYVYSFDTAAWTSYKFGPGFTFEGEDSGEFGSGVDDEIDVIDTEDTCSVTISPTDESVTVDGGSFDVTITAANSANIGYSSTATWVHLSGGPANGSGTLTVEVDPNTVEPERTATVGICGEVLTITQEAATAPVLDCSGTPGLIHWYKADAGVYSDAGVTLATNGQSVQQWRDQIGTLHLSQTTGASKPIFSANQKNGLPGVSFDGVDDYLQSLTNATFPVIPTNGYEFFLVCRLRTWRGGGSPATIFTFFNGLFTYRCDDLAGTPFGHVTTAGEHNSVQPNMYPGAWSLTDLAVNVTNPTTHGLYVQVNTDPFVADSGSHDSITNSPLSFGGVLGTWFAEVDINEVLMYSCPLTETERAQVIEYLNNRWAVY